MVEAPLQNIQHDDLIPFSGQGGRRFKSSLPDQQLSYLLFRNLRVHPSFTFELDVRSKRVMVSPVKSQCA